MFRRGVFATLLLFAATTAGYRYVVLKLSFHYTLRFGIIYLTVLCYICHNYYYMF